MEAVRPPRGRRWRSALLVLVSGVLLSVVAAGCGGSHKAANDGSTKTGSSTTQYTIDVANATENDPQLVDFHKGLDQYAPMAGVKLRWYDNNFDGPTAVNNARLMVQDKPDLIVEFNGVEGASRSIGAMFSRAHIPCIAVQIPVPGCPLLNVDTTTMGIQTAQAMAPIAKKLGFNGSNTTVILADVPSAGRQNDNCVYYFYSTMAKALGLQWESPKSLGATTSHVGTSGLFIDSKGSLEGAYAGTKNVLQSLPKNRNVIVYGTSDIEATGAYRAVKQAGLSGRILVAGFGSTADARDSLANDPNWVAEGEMFFHDWGEFALAMAVHRLRGHKLPSLTVPPQTVLVKDDLTTYFKPGADAPFHLPGLNSSTAYLKSVGVLQKFGNIQGLK